MHENKIYYGLNYSHSIPNYLINTLVLNHVYQFISLNLANPPKCTAAAASTQSVLLILIAINAYFTYLMYISNQYHTDLKMKKIFLPEIIANIHEKMMLFLQQIEK